LKFARGWLRAQFPDFEILVIDGPAFGLKADIALGGLDDVTLVDLSAVKPDRHITVDGFDFDVVLSQNSIVM
jgi:hypothetical protein